MTKTLIFSFVLVLTANLMYAQKKSSIYHNGWIDFNKNGVMEVFENPKAPTDERVRNLLSLMTVNEKTNQLATMYGYPRFLKDSLPTPNWKNEIWKDGIANIDEHLNGRGDVANYINSLTYPFSNHAKAINKVQKWFVEETRMGIPVDFTNEAIHGLTHSKTTTFPAPIGIGSTWNKNLIYKAGQIAGKEAKALGYTNIYAPILDVSRDPRWGRVLETYGEDPFLIAELGVQMAKGIQSQGVGSTLKHYAVYSVPKGGRDGMARTDPHVAPRELHQMYLYPFKRVVQEAHPKGVMSSYNDYDGVPISASHYFLTELLRQKYGFKGYVVSDSRAVEYVYTKHRVADSEKEAVRQVFEAGLNVRTDFTSPADYVLPLRELVTEGKVSLKSLDERVADVLRVKMELGLFDSPYVEDVMRADKIAGQDKHEAFSLNLQKESLVLLKNENKTLPLDKSKIKNILITGPLAKETNFLESRYGPTSLDLVTIYEGIKNYLPKTVKINYAKGCNVMDETWPGSEILPTPLTLTEQQEISEAVEKAKESDVIIAVLGEDSKTTGEGKSRTDLGLPGRQLVLLQALYATGKPVVLVLVNGQPLTINWANKYIPAILEAWFPAVMGGKAIAETLFGDYNPGGKLTITFPKAVGQIEYNFPFKPGSHANQHSAGNNGYGKSRVNDALYPFGYGLSYTTFAYSNLQLNKEKISNQGQIEVKLDITNTGAYSGDEVVQLYIKDMFSSVTTYESQLRGFEKVNLKPGETKNVSFTITQQDLELLDKNMNWTVEPGDFEVRIGASSEDIRLTKTFKVVD